MSVDRGPIDADHKKLIAIVNGFYAAAERKASRPELVAGLRDLLTYTRGHFAREEALQLRIGYGGAVEHRKDHGRIIERLKAIVAAMETQPLEETRQQTMDLVRHWIVDHVIGHDLGLRPAIERYRAGMATVHADGGALDEDDEEYWAI